MFTFTQFLSEAVTDESKLTHLEHAEDHVLNAGTKGFSHAYHTLTDVSDKLKGKHNDTTVSTKFDGSPSIVFGHHPESGKFFVGSKSVFNKEPKINHTEEDIDRNHGHAPGLAEKLKHALKHLPKVTPSTGVFQGDLMHSGVKSESHPEGDVEEKGGKLHFKPNTITYSTPKSSEEGKKIAKSKLGVVVHTSYTGKDLTNMKANYNADTSHFGSHPDVHLISASHNHRAETYTPEMQQQFDKHMKKAVEHFTSAGEGAHEAVAPHAEHLKTYINKTVREDTKPSVKGFRQHMVDQGTKAIGKVKTQAAIDRKQNELQGHLSHIDSNAEHYNSVLNMHHHLQQAKNTLVHAMSGDQEYDTHIAGQKVKPEGFVASRNNRPTKLVDRSEFSRANFLAREG